MGKQIAGFIIVLLMLLQMQTGTLHAVTSTSIRISEIKIGGAIADQPTEFIELHNDGDDVVDLSTWSIEYAKAAAVLTPQDCNELDWQAIAGTTNVKNVNLSGTIQPRGSVLILQSMNDDQAGAVRLSQTVSGQKTIYDLVGWYGKITNNIPQPPPCYETSPAPFPNNQTKSSIKRSFDVDGLLIDTDNNGTDFIASNTPTPVANDCPAGNPCTGTTTTNQTTSPPIVDVCSGIQLSELLPNPVGSDTTGEYIELYNSNDQTTNLQGCSLKLGASEKQYIFGDTDTLAPHEYKAFGYNITGLQLTNSGGEVWLVNSTEEEIVSYPTSGDDQAWANIGGVWSVTYEPTPNAENVLYVPVSTTTVQVESSDTCPEGKYRNPETNRCKNIESTDTELAACKEGQERSPETNRCRNIVLATASIIPCREGYERNEETNRCRKIEAVDASALKPCNEGEDRNPDTNRCRKSGNVAGIASTAGNAQQALNNTSQNYRLMVVVFMVAGAYGIYEYRHDFGNAFVRIRERFNKRSRKS